MLPFVPSLAHDAVLTFAMSLNSSISNNSNFIHQCGIDSTATNKSNECKMEDFLMKSSFTGKSVFSLCVLKAQ